VLTDLTRQRLIQNWQRTVQDVAASVEQAGRASASVRIIGVSKYVTSDIAQALYEAGCRDLGESRPQQLIEKAACLQGDSVTWHLIGHLQRNKARRMVELADWIHSVDSLKLLETIASYSQQVGRTPKLLIEVNVSGDADKHGFKVDELVQAWPAIAAVPGVQSLRAHGDGRNRCGSLCHKSPVCRSSPIARRHSETFWCTAAGIIDGNERRL
jgi:PLP dependent protein